MNLPLKNLILQIFTLTVLSACSASITQPNGKESAKKPPFKDRKQEHCVCFEIYQPVCGSDGKTYANSCFAECAGVSYTEGECDN